MDTSPPRDPALDPRAATLAQARVVVLAMAVAPLLLAAIGEWLAISGRVEFLVAPAALLGIVSPVIGYRLFMMQAERVPAGACVAQGCRAFLKAILVAMAVSEGIALFGLVAWLTSGRLIALIGIVTHMILVGAIWPAEARLERFIGEGAYSDGSG